jgi:putative hydrolase of HD superfamily
MSEQTRTQLEQQITFLRELDKLKQVYRQSPLMDNSRKENSAEHSWHVALAALVLAPLADEAIDVNRVIKMLLLHDIVEIDAGDTFAYDPVRRLDQEAREQVAADRLFGLLPAEQAAEFRALWDEFDARLSAEARFAHAVDRLLPVLHNYATGGGTWIPPRQSGQIRCCQPPGSAHLRAAKS